jgi:hypothetical protein
MCRIHPVYWFRHIQIAVKPNKHSVRDMVYLVLFLGFNNWTLVINSGAVNSSET